MQSHYLKNSSKHWGIPQSLYKIIWNCLILLRFRVTYSNSFLNHNLPNIRHNWTAALLQVWKRMSVRYSRFTIQGVWGSMTIVEDVSQNIIMKLVFHNPFVVRYEQRINYSIAAIVENVNMKLLFGNKIIIGN